MQHVTLHINDAKLLTQKNKRERLFASKKMNDFIGMNFL